MCRRSGSAFYAAVSGDDAVVQNEKGAVTYRSSDWAERAFCKRCGSTLWFRFHPTGDRSFSAGLFDEAAALGIEQEIFIDEAARWTQLNGDHLRKTGTETIAEAKAAGFTFN